VALSASNACSEPKPWAPIAAAGDTPEEATGGAAAAAGSPGPYAGGAVAVDAALRIALQRLFTTPLSSGTGAPPQFLYINHLGWCRGCVSASSATTVCRP
jgi:hypothetical protein